MKHDFMRRAVQLAIENVHSGNGGPFAAIVVKGSTVISEGQKLERPHCTCRDRGIETRV